MGTSVGEVTFAGETPVLAPDHPLVSRLERHRPCSHAPAPPAVLGSWCITARFQGARLGLGGSRLQDYRQFRRAGKNRPCRSRWQMERDPRSHARFLRRPHADGQVAVRTPVQHHRCACRRCMALLRPVEHGNGRRIVQCPGRDRQGGSSRHPPAHCPTAHLLFPPTNARMRMAALHP